MKRRILSLLLALCMIVGLLPMIALAEDAEHTHTPVDKGIELVEEREEASIEMSGKTYVVNSGKYVFQHVCAECGEAYTEEKTFQPALLDYLPLSEEGKTTRGWDYGTVWVDNNSSSYKPRLVINPGQTYYFTTEGGHETFTENKYVTPLTDEEKIADGQWNIKFEYPLYGDPIMTLKNAEVINGFGLYYGIYAYHNLAPLTIIVEGTNKFQHSGTSYTKSGLLNFRTDNGVTIIGKDEKAALDLDARSSATFIRTLGDLTIKNLKIDIFKDDISAVTSTTPPAAIQSINANVTIENCDIDINTSAPQGKTGTAKGIWAATTLTVTNSDIFALANVSGDGHGILHAADIVITECDLQLAQAYRYKEGASGSRYGDAIYYSNSITFNYASGFVAHSVNSRTTYYPDGHPTTGVQWTAPTPTSKETYTSASKLTATILANYYFDITHNHVAGDAVKENEKAASCTVDGSYESVTYCTVCDVEMSREVVPVTAEGHTPGDATLEDPKANCSQWQDISYTCTTCGEKIAGDKVAVENPEKIHTPGAKKELVEERVDAAVVLSGSKYVVQSGKYVFEYTCAVCGETYTKEETFQPAILDYLPLSEEGATTRKWDFGTEWVDNNSTTYKPALFQVINPGQTYYFTTEGGHATFTENKYVTPLTDEAKIEAGEWNIKFEYPLYGDPVMTLKNAEVINGFGLWYGIYAYRNLAPLTIIVEGTNKIQHSGTSYTKAGLLNLRTDNGVTIIGKGDNAILDLDARANTGYVRTLGDLTIENVTLDIFREETGYAGTGVIHSANGNITIKNCDVDFNSSAPQGKTGTTYGIYAKKTLSVIDSDIFALANVSGTKYGILHAADIVITESVLKLAQAYRYQEGASGSRYGDAIYYTNSITFNYPKGFVAHAVDSRTTYYPGGRIDSTTGENTNIEWTAPVPTKDQTYTSASKLTASVLNRYYFDITPNAIAAKFDGTAVTVKDDLTLEFAILADEKIPAGSKAYITKGGVTTEAELVIEKGYYVIGCTGIAAKEMHDQYTVVIKDAEGNAVSETKTDSVYDYIVRKLAEEKDPEMSDAKFAALKTVLVDMLNYGTMAQIQFNHNTENLANQGLGYGDWANATADMKETPAVEAKVEGDVKHLGTTFELNTNISMLIAVEGTVTSAKVYVDGTEFEASVTPTENGYSIITFNGLTAANGRKEVKFVINGDAGLTVTDSLAAYVGRNIDKYPYLASLMKYCDAADAYFQLPNAE